jgi:hypothetical protein
MKLFSIVPTSKGPRREFKITWGLRAGFGPSGRIYDLEKGNPRGPPLDARARCAC